jgi:hypothetical protein
LVVSDKPKGKLGDFLREVSNWSWEEFWRAERDKTYTSNEAVIFTLIRACAGEDLKAIRLSLNRMDGKLKTPVIIETPKVFRVYPFATAVDGPPPAVGIGPATPGGDHAAISILEPNGSVSQVLEEPELTEDDLPSMSLRETLTKMADYTRDTPDAIVELALRTEQWLRGAGPRPVNIPRVKSVVAAHLLVMAQRKNIDAIQEVFDSIDGRLAETIKVIGEDICIISYSSTAPAGAVKNKDGVYQVEAAAAQNMWASKLGGIVGNG